MASCFWINDAHRPLIELWRAIIQHPDDLSNHYARLWNDQLGQEREYFDLVRDRFNQAHQPADFLYLLARCVKAAIRYNRNGEFNNTPDNRRKGALPTEMRRRIDRTATLLGNRTRLSAWDYRKVLAKCSEKDVIYMDPPYQGVCGNRDQRYAPKVDHVEFCAEIKKLVDRQRRFVISYDGRTGNKVYGERLPDSLGLTHLEICAGRSTQATLLGRDDVTYESLYVSPALIGCVGSNVRESQCQMSLW
jgi:DNA adenine methylase